MRIAMIAPPWVAVPPKGYGGTEAVIDGLARGLLAAGHDVLLCTTGDSTCPVPRAWTLPSAVGTVNTGAATELLHVIGAYDAIGAWGADIVHDHTLVGPVYARDLGVPVVTTNHGPFDSELGALYRVISDRVGVIAISRDQATRRSAGTRLAAVIHHGIDVETVPAGGGHGGYALFLGRMSPDKGVDVAARVARRAGMPLKIAAKLAEPAEHEYFRGAVQPLLGGDIEYIGEIGHEAKWELLGDAVCLLNPTRWAEPFGMVMIEALACATPVVGTPLGAAPEIVEHTITGLLAATEPDLDDALRAVVDLDRVACREAASTRFSLARMVEQHVCLYERLRIEGRRPLATRADPLRRHPERADQSGHLERRAVTNGTRSVTHPAGGALT
jgi:glycosyltransferase involved in cell wall biosynthesis